MLCARRRMTRFHILDVHEDISVPGASEVLFSQATPYGLNPLRVGADPDYGGVNRCIEGFLHIVNKATGTLGARQEATLRKILLDVYRMHGFDPKRPETWHVDESMARLVSDGSDGRLYLDVPYAEREDASQLGARWDREMKIPGRNGLWWVAPEAYTGGVTRWRPMTLGRTHPTLDDVIRFTSNLVKLSFMGSDQEAVSKLEVFHKEARSMRKKMIDAVKAGRDIPDGRDDGDSPLGRAREKAIQSYSRYLESVTTGFEFDDLIKYDSTEMLKSVLDRMETLAATGLFKGEPPPFDPDANVWRYKLKPLSSAGKKMFVLFKLQEIFNEAVARGEQDRVLDVIVLDEAHRYVEEKGDDMLSTLAREARKFGVGVIACNQDADLPKAFIGSLGTKVVLGIDRTYWPQAVTKMGLDMDQLRWIQPFKTLAVQMHNNTPLSGVWRAVLLAEPRSMPGVGSVAHPAQ